MTQAPPTISQPVLEVNYASRAANVVPIRASTAAIVWVMIGGLALIGLGGCFLIGILSICRPELFDDKSTGMPQSYDVCRSPPTVARTYRSLIRSICAPTAFSFCSIFS